MSNACAVAIPGAHARRRRDAPGVLSLALASVALAGCASLPAAGKDDRVARVEILALLQTFNADLLSHDSATLTLERWCADHRLAEPARIVARRVQTEARPVPAELRRQLGVGDDERIGYRRVQLACGEHVLSQADNWYVPARLTAGMNRTLETTDEPFGTVVRPLGFQRRTRSAQLLWSPLPAGWELSTEPAAAGAPPRIPHDVLRHEAVLYTAAQVPFSGVVETYTNQLFDFGTWSRLLVQP